MPFTPYHFGPSGFAGLLLKKWVDVPVFVAANVLIDLEVIGDHFLSPGWPVHQLWHFHTLLVGGLAGGVFGAAIYGIRPLRRLSEAAMKWIGLPGRASLRAMILGGALGAWAHVLVDSFCHYDVQPFWPWPHNPMFRWMSRTFHYNLPRIYHSVQDGCLVFGLLAVMVYLVLRLGKRKASVSTDK